MKIDKYFKEEDVGPNPDPQLTNILLGVSVFLQTLTVISFFILVYMYIYHKQKTRNYFFQVILIQVLGDSLIAIGAMPAFIQYLIDNNFNIADHDPQCLIQGSIVIFGFSLAVYSQVLLSYLLYKAVYKNQNIKLKTFKMFFLTMFIFSALNLVIFGSFGFFGPITPNVQVNCMIFDGQGENGEAAFWYNAIMLLVPLVGSFLSELTILLMILIRYKASEYTPTQRLSCKLLIVYPLILWVTWFPVIGINFMGNDRPQYNNDPIGGCFWITPFTDGIFNTLFWFLTFKVKSRGVSESIAIRRKSLENMSDLDERFSTLSENLDGQDTSDNSLFLDVI